MQIQYYLQHVKKEIQIFHPDTIYHQDNLLNGFDRPSQYYGSGAASELYFSANYKIDLLQILQELKRIILERFFSCTYKLFRPKPPNKAESKKNDERYSRTKYRPHWNETD